MASARPEGTSRSHNVPLKLTPPTRPPAVVASHKHDPRMPTEESRKRRCLKCLYNKETNEFCTRTCTSWILILSYSAMYLIFLATYTLVILYVSLIILKEVIDYSKIDFKLQFLKYPEHGIGLTATPTSENNVPVIWYKKGEKSDYNKYVQAIDKFLSTNRRKREVSSLGPCGESPYGYGDEPCVIIRINKRFNWAGQPLGINSTGAKLAPAEVRKWIKADRTKLWLQCSGYHSYDKEHIGKIKYYPDPPGFDASTFPLDAEMNSPLVAIQITEFTLGISLAITCKLWYESGSSIIDFVLYVAPGEMSVSSARPTHRI